MNWDVIIIDVNKIKMCSFLVLMNGWCYGRRYSIKDADTKV